MTDDGAVETKTVKDSKFYQLARHEKFLSFLVPDLPALATTEDYIMTAVPRALANENTRIFINYTNSKGNPVLMMVEDPLRLDRKFDLDGFMNGLMGATSTGEESSISPVESTIVTAITTAVEVILGLGEEDASKRTNELAVTTLGSIIAVLFDDAYDVMIVVDDKKDATSDETIILGGLWLVKNRPNAAPVGVTLQ